MGFFFFKKGQVFKANIFEVYTKWYKDAICSNRHLFKILHRLYSFVRKKIKWLVGQQMNYQIFPSFSDVTCLIIDVIIKIKPKYFGLMFEGFAQIFMHS